MIWLIIVLVGGVTPCDQYWYIHHCPEDAVSDVLQLSPSGCQPTAPEHCGHTLLSAHWPYF